MATYSSILAWRIPWTEEPGRLQSIPLLFLDWLLLRHLSQLAFDCIACSFLSCTDPLRESDYNPHNPLTTPPTPESWSEVEGGISSPNLF